MFWDRGETTSELKVVLSLKVYKLSLKIIFAMENMNGIFTSRTWLLHSIRDLMALFHCMVRHGTVHFWVFFHWVQYLVPGHFFSTTSAEVPSEPYHYQNVKCKLCWSLIGQRKSSLQTCDTRHNRAARFKLASEGSNATVLNERTFF